MRKGRFAALLLIVVCSVGAVHAKASVVSYLTGSFGYSNCCGAGPLEGEFAFPPLAGSFQLNPANSTETQQAQCSQYFNCVINYWGHLWGGAGTATVYLQNGQPITVNASAINDYFSGQQFYFDGILQGWTETDNFFFRGTWSNDWYSTFNGYANWDFFQGTNGSINIYTEAVPEPSSLLLLGSGALGLIAWRKRLGM